MNNRGKGWKWGTAVLAVMVMWALGCANKQGAKLKKNKGLRLLIEGHCDERGTSEYNMALGDRRAESARAYLVSMGVPASAISTVRVGKEKPLDPGHNEAAWAKNSRDHFVVK